MLEPERVRAVSRRLRLSKVVEVSDTDDKLSVRHRAFLICC